MVETNVAPLRYLLCLFANINHNNLVDRIVREPLCLLKGK